MKTLGKAVTYLPLFLWGAAMIYFEGMFDTLSVVLAAGVHECGHLLAFSALGLPMPRLVPSGRGVRFATGATLSYRDECLVALAGPATNIGFALLFSLLPAPFPLFTDAHLLTAVYNLAPVAALDGERILAAVLSRRLSPERADALREGISLVFLFSGVLLTLAALYVCGVGTYPAFLLLFGLVFLPKTDTETEKIK